MSGEGRIRVMVVDDHPVVRSGLRETLEASGRFQVVGQAGDGEEAVTIAQELNPQVIVMDVIMPNKNGVDACREIMELLPETLVIMLTASTEEDAVIEAIAAGAPATCRSTRQRRSWWGPCWMWPKGGCGYLTRWCGRCSPCSPAGSCPPAGALNG